MTAISVVLVFIIGRRIGGMRTAYVAVFIYALTPSVLINGRRTIFESALMLFSAALIYLALRWLNKPLKFRQICLLGIVAGLTVASKHTGIITMAAAFSMLIFAPLAARHWSHMFRTLLALVGASLVSIVLFFALNASWWGSPLTMPNVVLNQRQLLLAGQVGAFGGFKSTPDRLSASSKGPRSPKI